MKKILYSFLMFILIISEITAQESIESVQTNHSDITNLQMQDFWNRYNNSNDILDYWKIEEIIPELNSDQMVTKSSCVNILNRVHDALQSHLVSLSLHKLALNCHIILEQSELAQTHENNLLSIASIITQSGDGRSYEKSLWASDINSAYLFLDFAGFKLIDAELKIGNNDEVYLVTYIRDKKTFGEFKSFNLTSYFKRLEIEYKSESTKWNSALNIILESDLKHNKSIIALAILGMSEAQTLLGDILIRKSENFKGSYSAGLEFYKLAAENGSAIGQYKYAYRVFIDQIESKYAQAHGYLTDSIEQRYQKSLILAIIIKEKEIGTKTDKSTVQDLIKLASLESEEPGRLEYYIGKDYSDYKRWDDRKLASKYFMKSATKGFYQGIIEVGNDYYYGRTVNHSYKKALKWYVKASETKKPENAYLKLGSIYFSGDGVKKNVNMAIEYNRKAALLESTVAYENLGVFHFYKKYEHIDYEEAIKWFKKGSSANSHKSDYHLGLSYYLGRGVEVDYEKSYLYFNKIIDFEYYEAMLYMGVMNELGQGVKIDIDKAKEYYERAYEIEKNLFSIVNLDLLGIQNHQPVISKEGYLKELELKANNEDYFALYQLAHLLNPNEFNSFSQKRKLKKLKKAGKLGLAKAYYRIGKNYSTFNEKKSIKYYTLAYKMGDPDSAYELAKLDIDNNLEESLKKLEFAIQKKVPEASLYLGSLYYEGNKVQKDLVKAEFLFKEAYEQGLFKAAYNLADLYSRQKLEGKNIQYTIEILKKLAIEKGYRLAMRNLGEIYSHPKYENFDMSQAIHWLVKASEAGDGDASMIIAKNFLFGTLVTQNYETALFFFADGLSKQSYESFYWLGLMLENGNGIDKNLKKAKYLYASDLGLLQRKESLNNLSVINCQTNKNVKANKKAIKTLESLSNTSKTALFNLAWINEHGVCKKKDLETAKKYYQIAADKKSPHALYRLYQLYNQGILFEKNLDIAQKYLTLSKQVSKKIHDHSMMSTFLKLPFIKDYKYQD